MRCELGMTEALLFFFWNGDSTYPVRTRVESNINRCHQYIQKSGIEMFLQIQKNRSPYSLRDLSLSLSHIASSRRAKCRVRCDRV